MRSRFSNGLGCVILATVTFASTQAAEQKAFSNPDAAAKALVAAAKAGAREEVVAILGEEVRGALSTGSPAQDQVEKAVLLKLADEATVVKADASDRNRAIVYLGKDEWPFPVQLVASGSRWRFDGKAGIQEIEDRKIGRNELGAAAACRAYVEAQIEYASEDHTGEGVLQYAQKIRSSPGKQDGLFWSNDNGEDPSPLGPFVANSAVAENGPLDEPAPFFGYYYRILTAQGSNAVGGAKDFLVNGHLLGGFGLVAWPAEYGETGVTTFVINHLGQIFQKDLGAKTAEAVKEITRFDPDGSWTKIE